MLCFVHTGEMPATELLPSVFELAVQYELADLVEITAAKMTEDISAPLRKEYTKVLKLHAPSNAMANEAYEQFVHKRSRALGPTHYDAHESVYAGSGDENVTEYYDDYDDSDSGDVGDSKAH